MNYLSLTSFISASLSAFLTKSLMLGISFYKVVRAQLVAKLEC